MNGSEPPSSSTAFLRCRPAISATAAPPFRAGEGHALDAWVGYHLGDLLVGGVDVDIRADGEACLSAQALEQGRGGGALRGVLEDDGVAQGEVRGSEPRDLIGGEVPRHDAEQHTHRGTTDNGAAGAGGDGELLVGEELLGVVGVVVVDVDAEVDFALRFLERLAHLLHDVRRQFGTMLDMQLAEAAKQRGALGDRAAASPRGGRVGGVDGRGHVGVGGGREGLCGLAGGRVGDGVHQVSRRVGAAA